MARGKSCYFSIIATRVDDRAGSEAERFRFAHMGATAPIPPMGKLPEESPLVWLEPPPLAFFDVKASKTLVESDLLVSAGSVLIFLFRRSGGPLAPSTAR